MGQRADGGTDDDAEGHAEEAAAEDGDAQHAHVNGRELQVGRHPGPEEVERPAVPLRERDVLDAPRLDRGYLLAVLALPNGDMDVHLLECCHTR